MSCCEVGYRHITREDYMTPKRYLPMQRMRLEVAEPCGIEQAKNAIIEFFGEGWFQSRESICDVEIFRCEALKGEK